MGAQRNGFKRESYILSVDVGITSIRCHIYDKNAVIKDRAPKKVSLS
uniref:Carbohydrate kinase FGGY N-terminal domain-containing protein n=1 Tax=Anguilla anguilla TaxID=7936 RepID=A0A0E9TB69_ANGAN